MGKTSAHAGSGFISILGAQASLFLCSFLLSAGLGRLLGPERFGTWGVVIGFTLIIFNVLKLVFQQSVAKFVSEDKTLIESIKRKSLKLSVFISVIIAVLIFLFAEYFVLIFKDPSIAFYFRIIPLIILFAGPYGTYMGYLTGLRSYKGLFILALIPATLRTIGVLLLVWLGFGIGGALVGFFIAIAIGIFFSSRFIRKRKIISKFKIKKLIDFGFYIFIFFTLVLFLQNLGLYFVKALLPIEIANINTGYYNAAFSLANLIYLSSTALVIVLFPLISKSEFKGDIKKLRNYIKDGLRYSLMVLAPLSVMIATNAKEFIILVYTTQYESAGGILSLLSLSSFLFALFMIMATIVSGTGKSNKSALIVFITLILNIIFNILLIPIYETYGAAISSILALFLGLFIFGGYIYNRYGVMVDKKFIVKLCMISVLLSIISILIPLSGFLLIPKFIFLGIVYLILLLLFGEIRTIDIKRFKESVKQLHKL